MSRLANRSWMALLLSCLFLQSAIAQTVSTPPFPFDLSAAAAQTLDPSAFSIDVDTVATDIGPLFDADLTGFSTYRLYVTTSEPADQLSAVYGNIDSPSSLETSGSFFQSDPIGAVTAAGVFPEIWAFYPSNQFDSYVTIGIDGQVELEPHCAQVIGEGLLDRAPHEKRDIDGRREILLRLAIIWTQICQHFQRTFTNCSLH